MEKTSFYRRTPPALFPSVLGFLGLGLLWRRFGALDLVPSAIGELILLIAGALFLATISSYVAKLVVRPGVLLEDLTVTPSRGAVPAGSMCGMLFSAVVFPYSAPLGHVVLWTSMALHLIYVACITYSLMSAKDLRPNVMPPLFLPYVGLIVGAMAGKEMGYSTLSIAILLGVLPFYVLIIFQSLNNLWSSKDLPPPVRASFAIILAPHSLFPIVAAGLMTDWFFELFLVLAIVTVLILMFMVGWLTKGGYNPGWGAFTFPMTAFGTLLMITYTKGYGITALWGGITVLGLTSILVPYVVFKTFALWKNGKLAANTGAATA